MTLPLPGPLKIDCPDGCGLFGVAKGKRGHVRGCPCAPCRAGRNSRAGKRRHRQLARELGAVGPGRGATSHEESWVLPYARVELKTGAQASPVLTRYRNAKKQSDASKSFGDARPFGFISWTGLRGDPPLITFTLEDHKALIDAFEGGQ